VVVVPFPFSDLTQTKRRPALVLAALEGQDVILCQITSQRARDRHAIPIDDSAFESGSLKHPSNVRPNRLFTADSGIVLYRVGRLTAHFMDYVLDSLVAILKT
jgi:mRNA interferase MazF